MGKTVEWFQDFLKDESNMIRKRVKEDFSVLFGNTWCTCVFEKRDKHDSGFEGMVRKALHSAVGVVKT